VPTPPSTTPPVGPPVRLDRAAVTALRDAVDHARATLGDVVRERAAREPLLVDWVGPHRATHDLLEERLRHAAHDLDTALRTLRTALEVELDHLERLAASRARRVAEARAVDELAARTLAAKTLRGALHAAALPVARPAPTVAP
jgi:CBS-domain-containing membrane protein